MLGPNQWAKRVMATNAAFGKPSWNIFENDKIVGV